MLPISFHLTFAPERRFLASLLEFSAVGMEGSNKEISQETGIPMGESSGKLPAILQYAEGMGLVEVLGSVSKKPTLTPFGEAIYREDRFLGEELTQWLAHFHLCRNDIGGLTWNALFGKGMLGLSFTKIQLENYLVSVFGTGKDRTGPMLVMYGDDASFLRAGVLKTEENNVTRFKAPLLESFATGYSAYILLLMETFFPGQDQVTVTDFNKTTEWFNVCAWNDYEVDQMLTTMGDTGYISIDRQMRPWIIEKRGLSERIWPIIWDNIA